MQNDNLQLPIWVRRSLPPTTDSFLEFQFDQRLETLVRRDGRTTVLIGAEKLHENGDYGRAAEILIGIADSYDLARRLLLDSLHQLDDTASIIVHFDQPMSATETIDDGWTAHRNLQ